MNSYLKQKEETLKRYLASGDISSFIMMDACSAMGNAKHGWPKNCRPEIAKFEQKWIHVYAKVNTDVNDITRRGKEWEFIYWMGFAPEDVTALLNLRHEWDNLDWENTPEERQHFLRSLWVPFYMDENSLTPWQPYFDRRVRQPLCEMHDWKHFSGETDKTKIMLGSGGGRVMMTVQDRYMNKEPESVFNGAWVTLIFDGTSKKPYGGLQGLCASREEAMGLLQHAIDHTPVLERDDQVFIA